MSRKINFLAIAGSLIVASTLSVSSVASEKQEKVFDTTLQSSTVAVGNAEALRQIGTGLRTKRQIGTGVRTKRQIGTGVRTKRQIGTGIRTK